MLEHEAHLVGRCAQRAKSSSNIISDDEVGGALIVCQDRGSVEFAFVARREENESCHDRLNRVLGLSVGICPYSIVIVITDEYTVANPVALIRQKSKFVQKRQSQTAV